MRRFPAHTVQILSTVDVRDYVRARKAEFITKQKIKERKKEEARAQLPAGARVPKHLLAKPVSPGTLNKELGHISAMLHAAPHLFTELADFRPPEFPWEKVSKRSRRRPISEDEEDRMIAALRAPRLPREQPRSCAVRHEVADIFEINLGTGMRGGETVKLTWPQIDWAGSEIYLGETKNGESRFVPMNSRVRDILERRYAARRSLYVFPNPTGERPRDDYSETFSLVARRAGLPYGQRTLNGWTMHSTRHTAITRMLKTGADIATVQEIVGHSDRTMTLNYSHATQATRKRAVESLVRASHGKKPRAKAKDAV